jgi:2-dehydro-3-deoxyphosphogluconate aldolase/(4S)-4-hydroxy-2-oxoglutarate aldolase
MPTGGVSPTEENLSAWFAAGVTCVGMGSKLLAKDLIQKEDYPEITARVSAALELIKAVREQ